MSSNSVNWNIIVICFCYVVYGIKNTKIFNTEMDLIETISFLLDTYVAENINVYYISTP